MKNLIKSIETNLVNGLLESMDAPYSYIGNVLSSDGKREMVFQPKGRGLFKVYAITRNKGSELEIHFNDDDNSGNMSGRGDAFRILSTIMKIVYDHLKKNDKIKKIVIYSLASDKSRNHVYKQLILKYASKWKFKLDSIKKLELNNMKSIQYTIKKKQ